MTRARRQWLYDHAMLALGLVYAAPVVLALVNSLKTNAQVIAAPLAWPHPVTTESYRFIFDGLRLARPMLNSLLMSLAVMVSMVTLGSMAAYGLNRRRMRSAPFWRALLLLGLTIPFQAIMIPLVKLFLMMGLANTWFALWLHYVSWGLPLCIFIYSAFIVTVPTALEEAAAIDGCGPFRLFWRIVFPLLWPCTLTVIIFWGLWIWNDFIQAFVIMGPGRGQLAFVQMYAFMQDQYVKNWSHLFASSVVLSLPITVLYVAMQRQVVKGLTAGAVK